MYLQLCLLPPEETLVNSIYPRLWSLPTIKTNSYSSFILETLLLNCLHACSAELRCK